MNETRLLTALLDCLLFLAVTTRCTSIHLPVPTGAPAISPASPTVAFPTSPVPTLNTKIFIHSTPRFQVFILNPVRTCIAANDFVSGKVAFGKNCSDHNCSAEEFDPPAPLVGISPRDINDAQYSGYAYRECFNITLTEQEIQAIKDDVMLSRDLIYQWTDGALDLQVEFSVLPHDHTGFIAPDFVFGPFEVDDELLNPYVSTATDFVYVFSGVRDRGKGMDLAYWCGSSYGELSIHGASYSYIQYNEAACNFVTIGGRQIYEATLHELYHNIDWALYNVVGIPDLYQYDGPDWNNWQRASWPACGTGAEDTFSWFPSIDYCEWDPDWRDCNNAASAGKCTHAGELDGQLSWYEHVMRAHYPRQENFFANFCRDGHQDFGESGVDRGGPCP